MIYDINGNQIVTGNTESPQADNITIDKSLNINGELIDNKGCFVTDFIEATLGETYKWTFINLPYEMGRYCFCEYDNKKKFINNCSWNAQGNGIRDIKLNIATKYIRATFPLDYKNDVKIEHNGTVIWQLSGGAVEENPDKDKLKFLTMSKYADRSPQFIGHGYGGEGFANAMSHFKWLVDVKKARFIECDVVNSKDGVGICAHVNASYRIYDSGDAEHIVDFANLTWAEIQQHTWTPSTHKYPSEKIIRCEELFKFCRRKNILLWMNCQQTTKETVTALHNLSKEMGISQNIFWDFHIDDATQNKICSVSTVDGVAGATRYLTKFNQVICDTGNANLEPSVIEAISNKAHSLGMYFSLWTIDDITIANKYFDNGCDFVGTNTLDNSQL